ncbi:hypothetical protein BG004_006972 [Podila humilis]|nr:hypothetical protein BG004_006972 [Podila humilis]
MKFTASIAIIAAIAASASAVVPEMVSNCTKSAKIVCGDNCYDFTRTHGVTVPELQAMNNKLRADCLNLDAGFPICVSTKPGAGTLAPGPFAHVDCSTWTPGASTVPAPTTTAAGSTTAGAGTGTTTSVSGPAGTATSAPTVGGSTTTTGTTANATPTVLKNSGAMSNKASVGVVAAGLIMSAVYLL